jgi:uncharacterized protein (DUF924 family)
MGKTDSVEPDGGSGSMMYDVGWFLEALATRNARDAIGPAVDFKTGLKRQGAPAEAIAVVRFWQDAGPELWFAKDAEFDRRFRDRFLASHGAAARGELASWMESPTGALALLLLLDQFPRNAFRGTTRMYDTDALARRIAGAAVVAGHDQAVPAQLRLFIYLPFGHSEDLADQDRSVALSLRLGEPHLAHAEGHRDIVRRFGRFPHRNAILGRTTTPDEQRFLDEGGFAG